MRGCKTDWEGLQFPKSPKSERERRRDILYGRNGRRRDGGQFHQHFTHNFFCTKVLCAAFLLLNFGFGIFWHKNALVKCWWNWHQQHLRKFAWGIVYQFQFFFSSSFSMFSYNSIGFLQLVFEFWGSSTNKRSNSLFFITKTRSGKNNF